MPATRDLQTILQEMKGLQDAASDRAMTVEEKTQFQTLGDEAREIKGAIQRENELKGFETFAREIPSPALPARPGEKKTDGDEVVGYVRLGDMVVNSAEAKTAHSMGWPRSGSLPILVKSFDEPLMPLTRQMVESKAVTITSGVIQPDRVAGMIDRARDLGLRVRELFTVVPTSTDAITYTVVAAQTGDVAPVAQNALKPELGMTLDTETVPVRTIAGWFGVTTQQLQDLPLLAGLINQRLRRRIDRQEGRQIIWGDGTGENLLGLMNAGITNATAVRTAAGDTAIDRIRRAITEIQVGEFEPTGIIMHPFDWEAAELTKVSSGAYLYAVAQDRAGLRLWNLQIAVTAAAQHPTSGRRVAIVGDFVEGAVFYDRMQATVQVGLVNDQLIRNQRTILGEERVALAVEEPGSFAFVETQTAAV